MLTKKTVFTMLKNTDFQEIRLHFPDGVDRFIYPILAYDAQNPRRPVNIHDILQLIIHKGYGRPEICENPIQTEDPIGRLVDEFNRLNRIQPLQPSGLTKEEEFAEEERRLENYFKRQTAAGWTKENADAYIEWYKDLYHIEPLNMPVIPA